MKSFNTTGLCIPEKHYMVDISDKVAQIRTLIDGGKYFTINRARQYGKTTTINALEHNLADDYYVLSLDFQSMGQKSFETEGLFVKGFCRSISDKNKYMGMGLPESVITKMNDLISADSDDLVLNDLFELLNYWCAISTTPMIMIIDEVDSATNNQVFLDFLAGLRLNYLTKEKNSMYKTFQSVILAGVTDVKHLKSKIRDEEQVKLNSPWNIAADFDVDMSLSADGIKDMLDDYANEHNISIDTAMMGKEIYEYTNGYPFLVSRLCQIIDEKLTPSVFANAQQAWTLEGLDEAVKRILTESNTLFESLIGKLQNNKALEQSIRKILFNGENAAFNIDQNDIAQLAMYGFIRNNNNSIQISNRIFETRFKNFLRSNEEYKE